MISKGTSVAGIYVKLLMTLSSLKMQQNDKKSDSFSNNFHGFLQLHMTFVFDSGQPRKSNNIIFYEFSTFLEIFFCFLHYRSHFVRVTTPKYLKG